MCQELAFLAFFYTNSAIGKTLANFSVIVDKNLKISLYVAILLFCLAIYLQVKGDKDFLLDVKEVAKQQ